MKKSIRTGIVLACTALSIANVAHAKLSEQIKGVFGKSKNVLSKAQGREFAKKAVERVKTALREQGVELSGQFAKDIKERVSELRAAGEKTPRGDGGMFAGAWKRLVMAELIARIKPRLKERFQSLNLDNFKAMTKEQQQQKLAEVRRNVIQRLEDFVFVQFGRGKNKEAKA
jgi:hypothetical protein